MRYRETREEHQKKMEIAKRKIAECPPEKNDVLAMIIAAFLVFLPVLIIILAIFIVIIALIFL